MKVLVAYASKHGSTKGIADFIGEKFRQKGLDADVLDVSSVRRAGGHEAFVLGSALYFGHWMKEAKQFTTKNKALLSTKPVWLFSSVPTDVETKNAKGQDLLDPSISGPFELKELEEGLQVKDHQVFFGAVDGEKQGFLYRQLRKSETIRKAMQEGDYRDWEKIEAWSASIVSSLEGIPETMVR